MSVFNQIMPAWVVENAVIETIDTWLETYLRETERQWGVTDELPNFRSYNVLPDRDKWTEDQLPAAIVVSPGLAGEPSKDAEGNYTVPFDIAVVAFAHGTSIKNVRRNTQLYAAAVRAILLQKSGLGGLSDGIEWTVEEYPDLPSDAERTIGVAVVGFNVNVHHVVNRLGGPIGAPDPIGQPGSEWPLAETEELSVDLS